MPEVGFEPTRTKRPAELESAPLDHSGIQAISLGLGTGPVYRVPFGRFGWVNGRRRGVSLESVPVAQLDKASDYESED